MIRDWYKKVVIVLSKYDLLEPDELTEVSYKTHKNKQNENFENPNVLTNNYIDKGETICSKQHGKGAGIETVDVCRECATRSESEAGGKRRAGAVSVAEAAVVVATGAPAIEFGRLATAE